MQYDHDDLYNQDYDCDNDAKELMRGKLSCPLCQFDVPELCQYCCMCNYCHAEHAFKGEK